MNRKDYVRIAAALKGAYPIPENNTPDSAWRLCVNALADALGDDNPRFDRTRFIRACQGDTK